MSEHHPSNNGRRRRRAAGCNSTIEKADTRDSEHLGILWGFDGETKDHRFHGTRTALTLARFAVDQCRNVVADAEYYFHGAWRSFEFITLLSISLSSCKFLRHWRRREVCFVYVCICFVIFITYFRWGTQLSVRLNSIRPGTDEDVNKLSIVLKSLDFSSITSVDVGGWTYQIRPRHKPSNEFVQSMLADWGGLDVSAPLSNFSRQIRLDDEERYEKIRKQELFAFDETRESQRYWHDDELEDMNTTCRRPNWYSIYQTTCNNFHAMALDRDFDEDLSHMSGDEQDIDTFYIK